MITLTIGGVDRTSLLMVDSLDVGDELNARNTAKLRIRDTVGGFRPEVGQEVIVLEDADRAFAGTIDDLAEEQIVGTSMVIFDLSCVDYNQIADRHLVARVYENQTLGAIVTDIVTQDLAGEGLTTTGVQTGPVIEKALFNYQSAAECFNQLSELTGYAWNIDYNKVLHFFSRETNLAPYSLGDASGNFRAMKVRRTRDHYRNRQYIRAGQDITSDRTETFKGDGENRTFTLAFGVAEVPSSVTVNGVSKTLGIRGLDTGCDFYWSKGEKEVTQDDAGTRLTASDVLSVTYRGFFPIILLSQADSEITDRASTEGGTGVYEAIEDDQNIDSSALATQKADGLLRRFGRIPRIVEWETDDAGLAAGQLITIENTAHDLSGQFLIDRVQTFDIDGNWLRYQIRALDGESLGGWADFFAKLASAGRRFVIRENEVLVLLRRFSDAVTLTDTLTATSAATTSARVDSALVGFCEAG